MNATRRNILCKPVRTRSSMHGILPSRLFNNFLRRNCFLSDLISRRFKSPATMSAKLACRDSASEID